MFPSSRNAVAAMSGHVTNASDNEIVFGACDLESEWQIATRMEALRDFRIFTQYYDAHDSDEKLQVTLLPTEKGPQ